VAIAVVAVLGVGGAWAATSLTGDDADSPSASSSTDERSQSHDRGEDSSGTAPDAPSKCVAEVAAAEKVADAVAASAKSWREHTDSQIKLDSGEYTREQTLEVWSKSKARGPEDKKHYAAAIKAAKNSTNSCASAAKTDDAEPAVTDCAERLNALKTVNKRGKRVHSQWSAHQKMMANKEHTSGSAYGKRWAQMVTAAGPALDEYDEAAKKLDSAPSCT